MNLNRLDAGLKLIQEVIDQGNIRNMRWTKQQQDEDMKTRKNPYTPATRHQNKK